MARTGYEALAAGSRSPPQLKTRRSSPDSTRAGSPPQKKRGRSSPHSPPRAARLRPRYHARPFVGVFKSQFYKSGHFLPKVNKIGQAAPRTGTEYPHEGPFVACRSCPVPTHFHGSESGRSGPKLVDSVWNRSIWPPKSLKLVNVVLPCGSVVPWELPAPPSPRGVSSSASAASAVLVAPVVKVSSPQGELVPRAFAVETTTTSSGP